MLLKIALWDFDMMYILKPNVTIEKNKRRGINVDPTRIVENLKKK